MRGRDATAAAENGRVVLMYCRFECINYYSLNSVAHWWHDCSPETTTVCSCIKWLKCTGEWTLSRTVAILLPSKRILSHSTIIHSNPYHSLMAVSPGSDFKMSSCRQISLHLLLGAHWSIYALGADTVTEKSVLGDFISSPYR